MPDLPNDPQDPPSPQATVGQSNQIQPPVIPAAPIGKERVDPASAPGFGEAKQEVTPITEFTRNVDLEPEVEGWLEKLEKEDSHLQQSVVNPQTGQVVLDNSAKQNEFKVVLPLTKAEVEIGLHHKVLDSLRWLAEWCLRLIKMFGNKVAYRKA